MRNYLALIVLAFAAPSLRAVEVQYPCPDQCIEPVGCEVVAFGVHAVCDIEESYTPFETQCTADNLGQTFTQTIEYGRGQSCFLHTYQECADGTRTDVVIDEIGQVVPVLLSDVPQNLAASLPGDSNTMFIGSNSNIGEFNGSISTTINLNAAGNDRLVVVHLAMEFTGSTGDTPISLDIGGNSIIGNVIDSSTGSGFRVAFSYYAFDSQLPSAAGTYAINATFSGAAHSNKEMEAISVEYHEGISEALGLIASNNISSVSRVNSGSLVLNPTVPNYLIVAGLSSGGTDPIVWGSPAGIIKTENVGNAEGSISSASFYGSIATTQTIGWNAPNTIRFGMVAGMFAATP